MQIKTIKKVITKKMESWLESIEDQTLREQVRNNLLVSGGSIASMLLNEPVNDYDIYIQDMDVLIKLAKYYSKGERVLDGRLREDYLKQGFPEIYANGGLCTVGDLAGEPYVAEGYVRIDNLQRNQVKLDIPSMGMRFEVPEEDQEKYLPVFFSQNAISLSNDIQIVLRFNGSVEQIHKTFDFIHATNFFTFKEGLVRNQDALESLITKNLKYQGSLYPLTSIIRMKKFIKRGWSINAGEILKIMFQISELDLKDIKVLEDQLIGVDVAYFSNLIEVLRGVDKSKITPSYLNTIIDRVFNNADDEL